MPAHRQLFLRIYDSDTEDNVAESADHRRLVLRSSLADARSLAPPMREKFMAAGSLLSNGGHCITESVRRSSQRKSFP